MLDALLKTAEAAIDREDWPTALVAIKTLLADRSTFGPDEALTLLRRVYDVTGAC